jgi:hypothetical protein
MVYRCLSFYYWLEEGGAEEKEAEEMPDYEVKIWFGNQIRTTTFFESNF